MENIFDISCNQSDFHCWACHNTVGVHAPFCNHCGGIQPVREMDCFQRLGLDNRVDMDMAVLEKNYTAMMRTFANERFILRSHMEKNFAGKHREAVQLAYDTLRDPVRRSRYWLSQHAAENEETIRNLPPSTIVSELQDSFRQAAQPAEVDRLAQRAGQEMELGIVRLLASLRAQDYEKANQVLSELDSLENLSFRMREKRQGMTAAGKN
jgi:DnaJ-domain-containing protein 1